MEDNQPSIFAALQPVRTEGYNSRTQVFVINGEEWTGQRWDDHRIHELRWTRGADWFDVREMAQPDAHGHGLMLRVWRTLTHDVTLHRYFACAATLEDAARLAAAYTWPVREAAGYTWYETSNSADMPSWATAIGPGDKGEVKTSRNGGYTIGRDIARGPVHFELRRWVDEPRYGHDETDQRYLSFSAAAAACVNLLAEMVGAVDEQAAYRRGVEDGRNALFAEIMSLKATSAE